MWESVEQDSFVFPNIVCYRSDESGVESGHFLPPSCFPEHTSSLIRRNTFNFFNHYVLNCETGCSLFGMMSAQPVNTSNIFAAFTKFWFQHVVSLMLILEF